MIKLFYYLIYYHVIINFHIQIMWNHQITKLCSMIKSIKFPTKIMFNDQITL